ncbi:hypothetical protein C7974DRAFT_323779, partial [Boeremia exigua]|uniref:uncharacterized protein n=1 Tax=Boeremia exigua TaxID=749465 RepID=UPI001E8DB3EA
MSSALSKTPPPTAELRLIQAISEFEADLSSIEKAKYRTLKSQSLSTAPSPGDVMCLTAEIDRRISDKFSGRCYGPRFTNFLQGVQQFAALGDVLVGGSQNLIACGVWSLSIVTVSSYVDKLSSIFMDIGRSAPRHQALTLLYPQSKKLPSYLSEYFTVVVNFCRLLFKFGQKSAVQQFASALSESRLKSFQVELDRWALCIKEETSLEDIKEGTGFRVVSKKFFQSTSDRQTRHTRLKVLDYCSTYDHEVTWKQIRKAGNTSSYMQCADYAKWRNSAESKTLIFVGKLGSGKSVSLANIVDDLNLFAAQERHPVAFFFCKHDVSASLSARTIIGSLTRQLLNAVPDLSKVSQSCEDSYATGDVDKVLDILIRAFPSHCKAYFVLDGFDECNTTEQGILIHAINKIQTTQKLVVCVSQRQESGLEARSAVGAFYKPHMVSSIDISSDIEAFIEAELERCLDQKLLNLGDPTLILEIQTALSEGSQGMFLWAALQIQSLCLMKTDYAIREALADLPRTLSETFSRILQKSGNSDPSLQTKTLQVVLAACRPLTTDELREALSVTPGDSFLDSSRILNDVYSALACCGCLLIVDEEELTVRVVHHSVKQYILGELDIPKRVSFSYQEAQRTLADIVITYLNYDVFGTELSNAKALPILTHSVPSKVLQTTLDFSNTTRQLALKILSSRKQSAFDMSKTIAEACGPSQPKPENPFRFYAYAKTYWQDH